ncbi:heavy metal translocating P-type ATPase [Bifidobacterium sp.]|uniref:heavy metal translocating P-type ATPase n=1 Tax=Bifidobacterium sp. TaxID=41200 RepID=UPI0039E8A78A
MECTLNARSGNDQSVNAQSGNNRLGNPQHGSTQPPAIALKLWDRTDKPMLLRAVGTAGIAIIVVLMEVLVPTAIWMIAAVTAAGLVYGCWPIIIEAWHDIRNRHMSMDLSMLIAIAAAAAIGQWTTSLLIAVFVLAAEILEDLCMDSGRDALSSLMAFLPNTVTVVSHDGTTKALALDDVLKGMVVRITPGDRIPVDGLVISGVSELDQSRITGESALVVARKGSEVYAGSVNQQGALEVRVTGVGEDSSYGRIIETVREAQNSQAPVQKLADRMATALVSLAVVGAFVTWLLTRDLTSAIDVIIVAGACGIAAGTPLAMLACIARSARSGAYVKDGMHMQRLSTIDTVIFDKTGTITKGMPSVVAVHATAGMSEHDLLAVAASAEVNSEHILGRAIVDAARQRSLDIAPVESFSYRPGYGIEAVVMKERVSVGSIDTLDATARHSVAAAFNGQATTMVYVTVRGSYVGSIEIEDAVRSSAESAIARLKSMGKRTVMLSGDREEVARHIAQLTGIDEYHCNLKPEQKLDRIEEMQSQGRQVAMIGDGVNDAPALTKADVGIAMGSGTDIAQESSDAVLVSSDMNDLARLFSVAQQGRRVIAFNFIGTIVIDVAGMVLAGFGFLTPLLAALVHVGSESAFILNSARLLRARRHEQRFD